MHGELVKCTKDLNHKTWREEHTWGPWYRWEDGFRDWRCGLN